MSNIIIPLNPLNTFTSTWIKVRLHYYVRRSCQKFKRWNHSILIDKAYFFIRYIIKIPHCCSLDRTFGKWSNIVFYNRECITTSWQVVIDNIKQLLSNLPEWWLFTNTVLLQNSKILYLESIVNKISTTETITASSRLSTNIFQQCTRTSVYSSSQPRRVFLFTFMVSCV